MKTELFVEINGQKKEVSNLSETAKEVWKAEGKKVKDLETVELYYKPEENTCYYVMNGTVTGSFEV